MCESEEEAVPGKIIKPTTPAMAMDESCPTAVGHARATNEATQLLLVHDPGRARAIPQTLGDDCHGDDFQTMQPSGVGSIRKSPDPESEGNERKRRRQCETDPRGESAEEPCARNADRNAHLTARRAG
jgi:hypothetical protein